MRIATGIAWCATALLALGLGALAVCPSGQCTTIAVDRAVLGQLHAWQHPWLTIFLAAATWLGSIVVLLPAALGIAWCRKRSGDAHAALLLPLAVASAWIVAHLAKLVIARPRPHHLEPLIAMPADLSFPSAHAMQIAAFAVALACAVGWCRWRIVATAATAVLVVALSRLYLQVHYPSDVLSGLAAGAAWALGLHRLIPVPR